MTKKDYILIARAIKKATSDLIIPADNDTIEHIVSNLAVELKKDNPKFDSARFIKACGLN